MPGHYGPNVIVRVDRQCRQRLGQCVISLDGRSAHKFVFVSGQPQHNFGWAGRVSGYLAAHKSVRVPAKPFQGCLGTVRVLGHKIASVSPAEVFQYLRAAGADGSQDSHYQGVMLRALPFRPAHWDWAATAVDLAA